MQTYIALLRGINVSGQKKINMNELLSYMEEVGLKDTKTYIQSGNLIFNSELRSQELKNLIQNKIEKEYNFFVPVLIFTKNETDLIIEQNPYIKPHVDIKFIYVTFLTEKPSNESTEEIKDYKKSNDEFIIRGKVIYIYCPGGYGRTKLTNNFFEKKLNVTATTRNWKTTLKFKEIAEDLTNNKNS